MDVRDLFFPCTKSKVYPTHTFSGFVSRKVQHRTGIGEPPLPCQGGQMVRRSTACSKAVPLLSEIISVSPSVAGRPCLNVDAQVFGVAPQRRFYAGKNPQEVFTRWQGFRVVMNEV